MTDKPSQSPFDRHGALVDTGAVKRRRAPLFGGFYENLYTLSHRFLGEWRSWRELRDENGIQNPFDLQNVELDSEASPQPLFEVPATPGTYRRSDLSLTTEWGVPIPILDGAELTRGTFYLWSEVERQGTIFDNFDVYKLALEVDGVVGPWVEFRDEDVNAYKIDFELAATAYQRELVLENGEHWLMLGLTPEVWIMLFAGVKVEIYVTGSEQATETRDPYELILPSLDLPLGRGES